MFRTTIAVLAVAGLLILTPPEILAGEKQVIWRTDYDAARKESSEKGLPLFLELISEGCFHCKRLEAGPLRDPAIVALLADRFIPVRVDGATSPKLVEALRVQSYPTIVLAHADGRIADVIEGYRDAKLLHEHLQRALAVESSTPVSPPGTVGFNPVKPSSTETPAAQRSRLSSELLTQAREAFKNGKYDSTLELCRILEATYKDLEQGLQAAAIAAEIRSNPEKFAIACEQLNERLAMMYASLGDSFLAKGDRSQASTYFEKAIRTAPASTVARDAQGKLAAIARKADK
jgi:tetratricopeptide (TPR) repeat protein